MFDIGWVPWNHSLRLVSAHLLGVYLLTDTYVSFVSSLVDQVMLPFDIWDVVGRALLAKFRAHTASVKSIDVNIYIIQMNQVSVTF